MSDLIDFDSPSTKINPLLASPLIPVPENSRNDGPNGPSEAGPHFSECDKRRSMENNPFDMVMKKITEYERNQGDPFERVIEKAKASRDDFVPRPSRRYSDILKMNKTLDETESNLDLSMRAEKLVGQGEYDMSIITDLNNTNLIADGADARQVVASWSCDSKAIPSVNISPSACDPDLSILNTSAMNDSWLDHDGDVAREVESLSNVAKEVDSLNVDFNIRPRSMSQNNYLSPKKVSPPTSIRRSLSVTDAVKQNIFGEDSTLPSAQSGLFNDPLNNAFRKSSLRSTSSNSTYLINQFNLSTSKQNSERLNSDSSVFSGLSNISAIQTDSLSKMRQERLCSDNSVYSGISNISMIPANSTVQTSCDSSVFSDETINKAFIDSRSQLNSTNSNVAEKTPLNPADRSDLIKKFFAIKTRMSMSQIEQPKTENETEIVEEKCDSLSKSIVPTKEECPPNTDERLIDVDNSSDSVFNDQTGVNDIIVHEARALADTFEKMASSRVSSSNEEDELFFSKTQLNFDRLPPSDDESVDNLIELPPSPQRDSSLPETNGVKDIKIKVLSPQEKIKALESEFIDQKDCNKKAITATLLLDLEKLIKEENNPDACKVLGDLQKLLGVECDNNTEILQVCLQNTNNSSESENKSKNESDSKESVPDNSHESIQSNENIQSDSKNNSSNSKEISEINQNHADDHDTELTTVNESTEAPTESVKTKNESQNTQQSESKESSNESSEVQKLAINLLRTLNTIVNEKNEDSAVDILRNLGAVLNMATELRTKNKDKQNSDTKKCEKTVQKQLNRSANSLYKSPSPKNFNLKPQNKSFEILPQRRSVSTTPTFKSSSNNLLEVPNAKDKRKSHLLSLKKRFPSDPEFMHPTLTKKKIESPNREEQQSSLEPNKPPAEPMKTKFKKKTNPEVVGKKGPLKAVIPLGNMQKRAPISHRISVHTGNVTPPKPLEPVPTLNIVSSTPNANGIGKSSKSKPAASSTPNVGGLKPHGAGKVQAQQKSARNSLACSVSPVSLNSSVNTSKHSGNRMERTLSPQKRPLTPRKNPENNNNSNNSGDSSRLPRYSPRPVRVRNYSMSDLKTAKSPQISTVPPKISSEKKIQLQRHSSVLSPLKNCNKLAYKGKPASLVSRLGKPNSIQTGPEKENYA